MQANNLFTRRDALQMATAGAATALAPRAGFAALPEKAISLGALAAEKGILFGASFYVGNLDERDAIAYTAMYQRDARIITSDLEFKLPIFRPQADKLDFDPADRFVAFGKANGMKMRAHTLIWNDGLPDWIKALPKENIQPFIDMHLRTVFERYLEDIAFWDVVNEPIGPWDQNPGNLRGGPFYAAMGEDYIAYSFRQARQLAPQGKLVLNEAQTETDDDNGKTFRDSFLALVKRLNDQAAPIDIIGLQCHLKTKARYDFQRFAGFVEELAALGYAIHITELDVNDAGLSGSISDRDAKIASLYAAFLEAVLPIKAVKVVQTWQMADHKSWLKDPEVMRENGARLAPRPLLYDASYRPKASWTAVADAFAAAPLR